MSDNTVLLVEKIKTGDKKAFEKLFLKFYDPLCNFAWRYLQSVHISEELVQEVFLKVWESRDNLDSSKNVKLYLYKAVRNKALNYQKHQKIAEKYNKQIDWLNSVTISQMHDFDEESEFVKAAQEAIENLPDGARRIYKLNRKDGLSYSEISEILDISIRTVESQMSRSLKKLRNNLSEYLAIHSSLFLKN